VLLLLLVVLHPANTRVVAVVVSAKRLPLHHYYRSTRLWVLHVQSVPRLAVQLRDCKKSLVGFNVAIPV
jgi:hypothetical protein